MEVDTNWDYNCPQFVDFTQPLGEDHNVDDYFNFDHENGTAIPVDFARGSTPRHSSLPCTPHQQKTKSRSMTPLLRGALKDNNTLTPRRSSRINDNSKADSDKTNQVVPDMDVDDPKEKENVTEEFSNEGTPRTRSRSQSNQQKPEGHVPANLCTNLENWPKKPRRTQSCNVKSAERPTVKKDPKRQPLAQTQKRHVLPSTDSSHEEVKRARRSESANPPEQRKHSLERPKAKPAPQTTHTRTQSMDRTRKSGAHVAPARVPSSQETKLHRRSGSAALTSTQKSVVSHTRTQSIDRTQKPVVSHTRTTSVDRTQKTIVSHTRTQSMDRTQKLVMQMAPPKHQRSLSASRRARSIEGRRGSIGGKDKPVPGLKKPKLTMPSTPAVLKHGDQFKSTGDNLKSYEERELEQIQKFQRELAQKRKMAEESHKKALGAHGYAPIKSAIAPTKAEGFHFATDKRLKNPNAETKKTTDGGTFVSGLRSYRSPKRKARGHDDSGNTSSMNGHVAPSFTIPAPFNFHAEKKRKKNDDTEDTKFKSMAEQLKDFSGRTPDRFRSKPSNKGLTKQKSESQLTITVPKTPNFTKSRSRAGHIVSQAELEEKEIEEIKKYKFRANPVNDKILKHANIGVHRVKTKSPTVPECFDLESERRIKEGKKPEPEPEERYEFHAKPVAKGILEGTVGVKPAQPIPLTHPASPAFALKNRLRSFKVQVEPEIQKQPADKLKAKPVPHPGVPFQPKLEHKVTEVKAFSFASRDRQMMSHKEEKIKKYLEEERKKRMFHANPLPSDEPDSLPVKHAKPSTIVEPFNFEVDHRGAHKAEEWEHRLDEEMRKQRSQAQFRAKPAEILHKQPFIPRKSTKLLTDVHEFELSTERRNERWAEIDRYRHEKEAECELQQLEMKRRQEEEEEAEARRQRMEAVHKAKPVRHYKPVEIKTSEKPLTLPETPRFSERLKGRFLK